MPTKPLDRLLFAQGGLCFFCKRPLSSAEASVEHREELLTNCCKRRAKTRAP